MLREFIMWLVMPFFKDDLLELQRYRNVVSDVHRWCSRDEKADKITQLIIDHGMSQCPYDISEFRKRLAYLDEPKQPPKLILAIENISKGDCITINGDGHACKARASKASPPLPCFDLGGEHY